LTRLHILGARRTRSQHGEKKNQQDLPFHRPSPLLHRVTGHFTNVGPSPHFPCKRPRFQAQFETCPSVFPRFQFEGA
jgi:hypothetical protein